MIVIVMGVSGSGKTTVGELLAGDLGWEFLDADDFHSMANKEKMAHGISLTDADREPWLEAMAAALRERLKAGSDVVLVCSALKQAYRDRLRVDAGVRFVYLKGELEQIRRRLEERRGHFFSPELLASQFEALEEPEDALTVPIDESPEEIVRRIEQALGLAGGKAQ